MNFVQAVILGLLQGITEFLPVSSSGHLVIGQKLFGFSQPPVVFDIFIHLGSLMAVLIFFKDKFLKISKRTLGLIIIASIPAGIVGLILNKYIEIIFNSLLEIGISLLLTAILLFSTKFIKKANKEIKQLKLVEAFIIGCFQALAILPGVSRSGSTIVAGLWQRLTQKDSFLFSFFLAVPAMIGAFILQVPELNNHKEYFSMGLVGFLVAAASGFLTLKILEKLLIKGKLFYFGIYCFILGTVVLAKSFLF